MKRQGVHRRKRRLPVLNSPVDTTEKPDLLTTGQKILVHEHLVQGLTVQEISQRENLTWVQVNRVKKEFNMAHLRTASVGKTRENLAAQFYTVADLSIQEAMRPEKLKRLSSRDGVLTAAIATDKARLLEGLSTENLSVRGIIGHLKSQIDEADALRAQVIEVINETA